jgi:hypothetical protein
MVTIKKDLRARFAAARDQGTRPTCLAFALTEAHAAERTPHVSLSADYLYYHALQRMPSSHGDNGVSLAAAIDALRVDGQSTEAGWPYSPVLPVNLSAWKPPHSLSVLFATGTPQPPRVESICALLDQDCPTVIVFRPTERFYYADQAGFLPARSPDPELPQLHAIVALGYGKASAGRHICILNSWGPTWGQQGFAWLAEDYLALRLSSVTTLKARR